MDFFHSVEFYVMALFVAFTLLGLIVSPRLGGAAASTMAAMDFEPRGEVPRGTLLLTAGAKGAIEVRRYGLSVREGETVYLTATIIDDKMTIVEKRGTKVVGEPRDVDGVATLKKMPNRKLHVRYDSEVTGEWGLLTFLNVDGNHVPATLKY